MTWDISEVHLSTWETGFTERSGRCKGWDIRSKWKQWEKKCIVKNENGKNERRRKRGWISKTDASTCPITNPFVHQCFFFLVKRDRCSFENLRHQELKSLQLHIFNIKTLTYSFVSCHVSNVFGYLPLLHGYAGFFFNHYNYFSSVICINADSYTRTIGMQIRTPGQT